jgi:hypothetical protein
MLNSKIKEQRLSDVVQGEHGSRNYRNNNKNVPGFPLSWAAQ